MPQADSCTFTEVTETKSSNCDLIKICNDMLDCDGIYHDKGKIYTIKCPNNNNVPIAAGDSSKFVIEMKSCGMI